MPDVIGRFRGRFYELSNFSRCVVVFDGVEYPSVEHAFQAAKDLRPEIREQIRVCGSPSRAKFLGGRRGIVELRPDWEDIKLDVMADLLRQKFGRDPRRRLLLSTGDAELVEGTTGWCDRIWGVCDGCAKCRYEGGGENHLGRLLMQVRAEFGGAAPGTTVAGTIKGAEVRLF